MAVEENIDPMMMDDDQLKEYMNSGQMDADLAELEGQEEDTVETPIEIDEQEDTTEQPNADSTVDTTAEEEATETETTNEPETEEDKAAESQESTEEDNSKAEEVNEAKAEDDVLSTYLNTVSKVKANKTEIEFTNKEKLEQFDAMYQKAANYTKKTQKLSKFNKRISAMEELGMTDDQFNTMVDVLKGDKDAITSVIKGAGIDALEIDTEQELNYTPGNYGKSNVELDIEEAYAEIDADAEGVMTRGVISNQWDEKSRTQIVNGITLPSGKTLGPKEVMTELHKDIKNGMYNKVAPLMTKLKIADGGVKSDLDYYLQAGGQYAEQVANEQYVNQQAQQEAAQKKAAEAKVIADAKAKQAEQEKAKVEEQKRKDAAVTKTNAAVNNTVDYLDVEDMTDEEFKAMYEKL